MVVGGIVPDVDVPKLLEAGVAGVLTPGASSDEVVAAVRDAIDARVGLTVDRVERLTNLLALLLETTRPLTLVEIAGEMEGQYPTQKPTLRAAFERDKAALREIGVPIEAEVLTGDRAGESGYRIDRAPLRARRPRSRSPTSDGRSNWRWPPSARRRGARSRPASRRCGSSVAPRSTSVRR